MSATSRETVRDHAEGLVRLALGEERLGTLVQAMLDQGLPPIFLSHAEGSLKNALTEARELIESALDCLDESTRKDLATEVDGVMRGGDLVPGLVELATWRQYFALPESIFLPPAPDSRVFSRLPSLIGHLDEDGLLALDALRATDDAVFVEGYALHYHQLLRRSFGSGINSDLVATLIRAGNRDANRVKVAIDERRLLPESEHWSLLEKDFLRGPPLTRERLDDRNEGGVTVHWHPDPVSRLEPYSHLQVYWRMQDPVLKVVQMEELIDPEHLRATLADGGLVPVRYLHAIRNVESGEFIHCDGAVRTYSREAYAQRMEDGFPPEVRAGHRRKVFRLDGSIETGEWSDITARWFRHNELALEYLSSLGAFSIRPDTNQRRMSETTSTLPSIAAQST